MKKILCFIPVVALSAWCAAQQFQFEKYESGKGFRVDIYSSYTTLYLDVTGSMAKKIDYTKAYNENSLYYYTERVESVVQCLEASYVSWGLLYRMHYKELDGKKFRTLSFNFHPTVKLGQAFVQSGKESSLGYGSFNLPISWNINSGTSARVDGRIVKGKRAINGFSYGIGLQTSWMPIVVEDQSTDEVLLGKWIHFMPFINMESTKYKNNRLRLMGLQIGYFPQNYIERVTTTDINGIVTVQSKSLTNHAFLFRFYYGGNYHGTFFTGGND